MPRALTLLYLTAACWGSSLKVGDAKMTPPIVGGNTADIEDFPYQLAFLVGESFCGATIISKDWALTAAHCTQAEALTSMTLRAGSSTWLKGGSAHNVSQNVVHPNHQIDGRDYDYSLLRVDPPFAWGPGVAAIPLVEQGEEYPEGTTTLVSGWGSLSYGSERRPTNLQAVEVPLTSIGICKDAFGDTVTDRMICAGLPNGGRDTCQGDYGGPLVINGVLVGVASFGRRCGMPGYPGVYAKVADQRDWIRETTGV